MEQVGTRSNPAASWKYFYTPLLKLRVTCDRPTKQISSLCYGQPWKNEIYSFHFFSIYFLFKQPFNLPLDLYGFG